MGFSIVGNGLIGQTRSLIAIEKGDKAAGSHFLNFGKAVIIKMLLAKAFPHADTISHNSNRTPSEPR